ncbi:class I SAM-dependent methyltransferase [Planomicrobium sp. Y74]|uniref:class I SAM-dependent methyltransferase n=1 Tax=Planomicrobium sp. Y74 TaxID=2478977 RepID=UPI000EF44F82|nr:class I SAM-dependent methyltransferase [Planomicrobium sp. Y74]RLQ91591.1 class I SAM-dependent methyltransferase [Planomicrobium sp. Y74]
MNDYYGELCTQVYETNKSIAGGEELEFYLSYVKHKDMQLLEPMCGNGRMLLPFLEKGIDIDGFDISEEMLSLCRMKAQNLNLKPNVFHCRLEEYTSDKRYDLVLIPFGSFSLLPDELVKDSLANMRNVLKDDGKILLTVITNNGPIDEMPDWVETNRQYIDGNEIIEYKKMSFDQESKMLNTTLKYHLIKDGQAAKEEIMEFPVRLYEKGEFENVLKANGFKDFTRHEVENGYGAGSSFHVFECGKQRELIEPLTDIQQLIFDEKKQKASCPGCFKG